MLPPYAGWLEPKFNPASPDDELYGTELTDPIPSRSSSIISYGVKVGIAF
jgi:hypothetical protein